MTDSTTDTTNGPGPVDPSAPGSVTLVIPAEARYLRLARLTAAGLAGDLGYGVDAIEDLRIAVDELCAAVIEDTEPTAELTVTYREVDGAVVVDGVCNDGAGAAPPELHGVAKELLSMLADEYEVGADGRGRTFRLVKRPRSGS